jgi:3-methyladenine DNA glycosylase AlkD
MASLAEVMDELRALGSPQFARTYRRHGAGEDVFGVSTAHLGKVVKRIKRDHPLAQQLWATGNYDARILATMIADPAQATEEELETWVDQVDCYPHAGAVASFAGRKAGLQERAERWIEREEEWPCYAGWLLMATLAQTDESLPDAYFLALLERIERDLHGSKNWVRHSMNAALITIGARNRALEPAAKMAARRIGKVQVDHGDTACKTPDAAAYMDKIWARQTARGDAPSRERAAR